MPGTPASKAAQKTEAAFEEQYGKVQGEAIYNATINKARRHKPGDKFLKSQGAVADEGAASGGQGHEHAKASPFKAKNASKHMHRTSSKTVKQT